MSYVPRLVLAPANAGAPPAPIPDTPGVHTWRNTHGGVVATGFTIGAVHWMHWPHLAAYRFSACEPDVVTAFPVPGAPLDILQDTYVRSVMPMALQALGYEALHASAVLMPEGVVGFLAASETGKSTIAYGLAQAGYSQWGDDSLLFDPALPPPRSRRLPFDIRLRPPSSAFFQPRSKPEEPASAIPLPETGVVAALCLLSRADLPPHQPALVRRLDPVRAFSALIAHAHCFNPHDASRRAAMLRYYLQVTGCIPVFEVAFRPVLADIPAVLNAVVVALGVVADEEPVKQSR